MALDDSLADRQPDAASWIRIAPVKALEHGEYAIRVLRIDPDPVVGDAELPVPAIAHGGHLDARQTVFDELDAVRDQVLEQLAKLAGVPRDGR
jgi:hypothetical protein